MIIIITSLIDYFLVYLTFAEYFEKSNTGITTSCFAFLVKSIVGKMYKLMKSLSEILILVAFECP